MRAWGIPRIVLGDPRICRVHRRNLVEQFSESERPQTACSIQTDRDRQYYNCGRTRQAYPLYLPRCHAPPAVGEPRASAASAPLAPRWSDLWIGRRRPRTGKPSFGSPGPLARTLAPAPPCSARPEPTPPSAGGTQANRMLGASASRTPCSQRTRCPRNRVNSRIPKLAEFWSTLLMELTRFPGSLIPMERTVEEGEAGWPVTSIQLARHRIPYRKDTCGHPEKSGISLSLTSGIRFSAAGSKSSRGFSSIQ